MSVTRVCLVTSMSCIASAIAAAAPTFTTLPNFPSGEAQAMNSDGTVILGNASVGGFLRAFRWTAATGGQYLPLLPGGSRSTGFDISNDGSTVVGWSESGGTLHRAFRWTVSGGIENLGGRPGGNSEAVAVSADGQIVAGTDYAVGCCDHHAFRWTAPGTREDLGVVAGSVLSIARGISDDGSAVFGTSFRWTAATGMQSLGPPPAGTSAPAIHGCSGDGATAFGFGNIGSQWTLGIRWTQPEGMQAISPPAAWHGMLPFDSNRDGTVIVGRLYTVGMPIGTQSAFMWTPTLGTVELRQYLLQRGVAVGISLASASCVSPNGRFIAGGSWIVDLRGTCPIDFNDDGAVDFFDYLDFVDAFAGDRASADYNSDGITDFFDYLDFVGDFSVGC